MTLTLFPNTQVREAPLLENLIPGADVVFVSKDFARSRGFNSMESAVVGIAEKFASNHATGKIILFKNSHFLLNIFSAIYVQLIDFRGPSPCQVILVSTVKSGYTVMHRLP